MLKRFRSRSTQQADPAPPAILPMPDPALLREDPERVRRSMGERGLQLDIERLVELDARRRQARHAAEEIRAEQRALRKTIARLDGGEAKQKPSPPPVGWRTPTRPLLPRPRSSTRCSWPVGRSPQPRGRDRRRRADRGGLSRDPSVGDPPVFDGEPADHQELRRSARRHRYGARAAKVAGARFAYLAGDAVLLELGLLRWTIDRIATHGFKPVMPPVLVRRAGPVWHRLLSRG